MIIEDALLNTAVQTVIPSAAYTATQNGSDLCSYGARGCLVFINCSAAGSSPSDVVTIQGKDSLSGVYFTILASAAITGTGFTVLKVYPGLPASANVSVNDVLPRFFRVIVTAGNSTTATYSISVNLIP